MDPPVLKFSESDSVVRFYFAYEHCKREVSEIIYGSAE